MFRHSVCTGSSRGTLALGDGFIKTEVTEDLRIFQKHKSLSQVLDSSLLPDRAHMATYYLGLCSSVKEILSKHPNICITFIFLKILFIYF